MLFQVSLGNCLEAQRRLLSRENRKYEEKKGLFFLLILRIAVGSNAIDRRSVSVACQWRLSEAQQPAIGRTGCVAKRSSRSALSTKSGAARVFTDLIKAIIFQSVGKF